MNDYNLQRPIGRANSSGTKYGLTVNWIHLLIGGALCYFWLFENWAFLLSLAVVVLIHELGHVVMGRFFGCVIKEMQVFILCFLSYKPLPVAGRRSWRNITWSLGTLPLGGFTTFMTRPAGYPVTPSDTATSPYLDDKPARQRLLIAAGGVIFNFATFIALYIAMPHLSDTANTALWDTMMVSLIFAVLNILPVYPLDGGSIIFACYEMITGRKPSKQFISTCGIIGMVFILLFFWIFPQWMHSILDRVFNVFF